MDSPPPSTRRELLQRGGLLAGAIAVGSWSAAAPAGTATAAVASVALSDERRHSYSALAEAVVTGPTMRLPASAAEQVVVDFESAYITWPVAERRHANTVLDALARDARMQNRSQRAAMLRGSNPRDAELAYRACGLVAVALSSGLDDHAEVSV
jgi:hypothetical protein